MKFQVTFMIFSEKLIDWLKFSYELDGNEKQCPSYRCNSNFEKRRFRWLKRKHYFQAELNPRIISEYGKSD